ncbi:MAG: peptidylprolyl isomerase [Acidobacteriota bacterium]|nr:peptidylprolyl isomerase [Acidobacteriota bacterium]
MLTLFFLLATAPNQMPAYFVKIVQERTLFARDEPAFITLRLGNQTERDLRARKWPQLLEGLTVKRDGKALALAPKMSSKNLFKRSDSLGIGAHRDFRIRLSRFFPDVKPGAVYEISYEDKYNEAKGKKVSIVNLPMPDPESRFILKTSKGDITIELDTRQTPNHAKNFALLASMKFYKDMIWHRVIKGYVIQTGDPVGTGESGSGYEMELETTPFLKHEKYTVGMARGPALDSATSQFYITLNQIKELDNKYTIFGKVVDGFEVVDAIADSQTTGPNGEPPDKPVDDVRLDDIIIEAKQ